ncbi:unnamed protein product [Clavelina lepadiformis]|uniref:Uncharacterized protein n=1 Tax=Clavelina lepadiformis TaxID=159417 RepID=A0ABP0GUP9_CLALP
MIGRADIEGSKSNVAMNAWLPQASYPCDVPPQSNSPPDTVFRANRAPPEGDALKARKRDPKSQAQQGLLSPANSAKPVPLAVVSLDIGFPESVPVLSQLFDAGRKRAGARVSCGIPREETDTGPGSRPPPDGSRSSPSPVQPPHPASCLSPTDPALRANPFPEVTDLVCRLPLPTLFYRPEAVHLGDLLRIWVRSRTKITPSPSDFPRADASSPDTTRDVVLYGGTCPYLRANRFQGRRPLPRKRELFPGPTPAFPSSFALPH